MDGMDLREEPWRTVREPRQSTADNVIYAVKTTGIFCRPEATPDKHRAELVDRACRKIESGTAEPSLARFAAESGMSG